MSTITCSISLNLVDSEFLAPNIISENCGDINVNLLDLQMTPLSAVTNMNEFNSIIFNELMLKQDKQ